MKKTFKYLEIVLFVIFAIIIGSHHEPWADEAQSWLLARDVSVKELIFTITSYEGCFPLWFLVLKVFIFFGLEYKKIYVVSILFSTIGLVIFLNNEKIPLYIKILLPFSYYIFYQYTIVARNYCFLFLLFSIFTFTYPSRNEKIGRYILNLIFFSFVSLHGMLISGLFGILSFLELLKEKKYKNLYWYIILGIVWIIELYLLIPKSDLYININALSGMISIIKYIFSSVIIVYADWYLVLQNIITFGIFLFIAVISGKNKNNKDFLVNEIGMIFFYIIIRSIQHHYGVLFLLVIFGIIINYDSIIKNNKYFEKIMLIMLVLYSVYTIQSSTNDFFYDYCGSQKISEYIYNNINYEESNIYTIDYYTTAILPYFDEIIFKERNNSYYYWSTKNKYYWYYNNFEKYREEMEKDIKEKADYIVIDDKISSKNKYRYIDMVKSSGVYQLEYEVSAKSFYKNYYSEPQGFLIYKKVKE